jgi:DNA modification methylase
MMPPKKRLHESAPLAPLFRTKLGRLFVGKCEDLLAGALSRQLAGKVDLIFTSPPFPLNDKKRYGNLQGDEYRDWLAAFSPLFAALLTPRGSVVVEVGNAWEPGRPVQSTLPQRALLAFLDAGKLQLCQEITYYNPARLPSPAQWVTVNRMRLKDATTKIWWMAKCDEPNADNRRVLRPYSKHMKQLLERQTYNAGLRPSEHIISAKGFLRDNGGAIAPNLLQVSNTHSNGGYLKFCKDSQLRPHPARMPEAIPEFFIRFLTEPGGLVLDPFAGSNTTGITAEKLGRRWISFEADRSYATASVSRFDARAALKLLKHK